MFAEEYDINEEIARLDRLRQKLLDDAARSAQAARGVEQAVHSLRMAHGTKEIVPVDPTPVPPTQIVAPAPKRRGRPPTKRAPETQATSAVQASEPLPTYSGDLNARIREELTRKSMNSADLAAALNVPLDLMEHTLYMLVQAHQAHFFEEDGKYAWCVGLLESKDMQTHLVKLLNQHHVMRHDLMRIFCADGPGVAKKDQSRVQNNLDSVRMTHPVHMEEAANGRYMFWLVGDKTPPKDLDGRLPSRVRKDRK